MIRISHAKLFEHDIFSAVNIVNLTSVFEDNLTFWMICRRGKYIHLIFGDFYRKCRILPFVLSITCACDASFKFVEGAEVQKCVWGCLAVMDNATMVCS
jgi:hypothetical protein